jgi:hypothetical protein
MDFVVFIISKFFSKIQTERYSKEETRKLFQKNILFFNQ